MTTNEDPPTLGEYNGHEIYPMPAFATLTVADVSAVAAWYERTLGFSTVFRGPEVGGQPALVHLRRLKYQDLLLTIAQPGGTPAEAPSSLTLSFSIGEDVDALADRARSVEPLGQSAIAGPVDTPWNTRDLRVTDPAGHRLIFTGRNPNPDPAQLARMGDMFARHRGTK
jgi:catechol 2,3-dioxygenase-like lactoylglutathione lyase family enzyme